MYNTRTSEPTARGSRQSHRTAPLSPRCTFFRRGMGTQMNYPPSQPWRGILVILLVETSCDVGTWRRPTDLPESPASLLWFSESCYQSVIPIVISLPLRMTWREQSHYPTSLLASQTHFSLLSVPPVVQGHNPGGPHSIRRPHSGWVRGSWGPSQAGPRWRGHLMTNHFLILFSVIGLYLWNHRG